LRLHRAASAPSGRRNALGRPLQLSSSRCPGIFGQRVSYGRSFLDPYFVLPPRASLCRAYRRT
jgi:hypothetical protein